MELLPPHVPLAGVDPGTSSFIGVYRDVALAVERPDRGRRVLAIEVEDVRSEGKLPSYSRVVRTFHFATGHS